MLAHVCKVLMRLNYFSPSAVLAPYIGAYYYYRTDRPSLQTMCAELGNIRFVLDGALRLTWETGASDPFYPASLIGPTGQAYTMRTDGPATVFGAVILPKGWRILSGVGAQEVSDHIIDLHGVLGNQASETQSRLGDAANLTDIIACTDHFFEALMVRFSHINDNFPAPLERWLLRPDNLGLDALISDMGISRRQVDRLAKRYFGASPKALQRKYRALHALGNLAHRGAYHGAFTGAPDFYDQSHFIKEFKTYIGVTPGEFESEHLDLMKLGMAQRSPTTHKHPLLMI